MPLNTHKYSNGEITIIWQPNICIHSGICAKGSIEVFDPRRKPWINMSSSDSETIKAQIKKCPSGALSYIETEDK